MRVDVLQTSATSTVMRGSALRGPALRSSGFSLRIDGVQARRIAGPAVELTPYSPARMADGLRAAGVPVGRLAEIARTLDNAWHGDPAKAAQTDAQVMEELAPLRSRANRAEVSDGE